jgi:hypothetical protein
VAKDGRITRTELEEGIRRLFSLKAESAFDEGDFAELHEIFDADGDGMINLHEWKEEYVHGYEIESGDEEEDEGKSVVVTGGEHQGKQGHLAVDAALQGGEMNRTLSYAVTLNGTSYVRPTGTAAPKTLGKEGDGTVEDAEIVLQAGETLIMGEHLELLQPKKDMGMTLRPPIEQINAFYKVHKQRGTPDFPYPHTTKSAHYPPALIPMPTCPGGVYCTVDAEDAKQAYLVGKEKGGGSDESEDEEDEEGEEGGEEKEGDDEGANYEENKEAQRIQKLVRKAKKHCANQTWTVWGTARWGAEGKFRAGHATAGPAMVGATIEKVLGERGVMAVIAHEYPARERMLTDNPVHSCMTQVFKPMPAAASDSAGSTQTTGDGSDRAEAMLRAKWKPEESLFQSRLLESESGTLVDTNEMLEGAFEADWRVTVLDKGELDEMSAFARGSKEIMATEVERLKEVMKKHYPKLRAVFRHLCGWHSTWSKKAVSKVSVVGAFKRFSPAGAAQQQSGGSGARTPDKQQQPASSQQGVHQKAFIAEETKAFLVNYSFMVSLDTFLRFANTLEVVEHTKFSKSLSCKVVLAQVASPAVPSGDSARKTSPSNRLKKPAGVSRTVTTGTGPEVNAAAQAATAAAGAALEEGEADDGGRGIKHERLRIMFEEANEDPFLLEGNSQDTLERHEFLEITARLAMGRYCKRQQPQPQPIPTKEGDGVKGGGDTDGVEDVNAASTQPVAVANNKSREMQFLPPSEAVERFMANCMPRVWAPWMDANAFRTEKLYTFDAAQAFDQNLAPLNRLFASYAEAADDDDEEQLHEFGAQLVMGVADYFAWIMQAGILYDDISEGGAAVQGSLPKKKQQPTRKKSVSFPSVQGRHGKWLGKHEALQAFLMSSLTVENEMESSEYRCLSFIDFLECLGRLADIKYGHEHDGALTDGKSNTSTDPKPKRSQGSSTAQPPEESAFAKALRKFLAEVLPAEEAGRRDSTGRRMSRKFSVSHGLASPLRRASRAV